jgi:hypothetical protein
MKISEPAFRFVDCPTQHFESSIATSRSTSGAETRCHGDEVGRRAPSSAADHRAILNKTIRAPRAWPAGSLSAKNWRRLKNIKKIRKNGFTLTVDISARRLSAKEAEVTEMYLNSEPLNLTIGIRSAATALTGACAEVNISSSHRPPGRPDGFRGPVQAPEPPHPDPQKGGNCRFRTAWSTTASHITSIHKGCAPARSSATILISVRAAVLPEGDR